MPAELEYGTVSAQDFKACRIRVRLPDRDGLQSYWLHVPQRHTQGTQARPLLPEMGEQVAVLLDADGVGGVYLGGIYSTAEPPPVVDEDTHYVRFSDGTSITYDRVAHALAVDCIGGVLVKAAQTVTVDAGQPVLVKAPKVTLDTPLTVLTGDLQVAGSLDATGDLQVGGNIAAGGTIIDVGGNSNHHSH
jgi:phage baseplate assembly protein V